MEGVIGFTTMFAGNFAPKSWSFCQGQTINIASNTALFSILGTTYGGNGTTTFMLPNLQGRKVVGVGTGPGLSTYALGQAGGSEMVTLTTNQMPAHVHPIQLTATPKGFLEASTGSEPNGSFFTGNGDGYSASHNAHIAPYNVNVTMSTVGSDTPYEILQPYMGMNYIICVYGVFPARN